MSLYENPTIQFLLFLHLKRDPKEKIGFSRFDAPILSSIANYVMTNHKISPKQLEVVENRLRKYNKRQLDKAKGFDVDKFLSGCLID